MLSTLARAVAAGALLAGSVSAGDHFILTQVRTLTVSRVDPLLTPGQPGPHVHNVNGGSMFGPNSGSPDTLAQSRCSSTLIGDDKSSYWVPQVYYNHGNGSYSPMIGSTRIYYFLKPLNGTTPVKPFPRGFRMMGGAPSDSRPETYPPRGELTYEQQQAMDPRVSAIKWGCAAGAVQGEGTGGSLPGQRPYLPNDAPNGCGVLNAGIFYPSCSDGRLDSDDHFSHMAYPLDGPNGYNCPPSHSIKYPTIFLENFYFPPEDQPYRGANQDNWVLSNGDTLGLTFHADFINGWNQDTLEQTLQQCNTPNAPESDLQSCAPLAKSYSVENANDCRSEGLIADEDVGLVAPINALPGCNPIWPVEARTKPSCKTDGEVQLVKPSAWYTVDEFKLSVPIAGSKSKVATAPAGATDTYPTSSYDYNYGASSSSSAAPTSSSASADPSATSSYDYNYGAAPTSSSAAISSSSYDYNYAAASSSSSVQSSSSVSAEPTSSSSYDYNYGAAASTTEAAQSENPTSSSSSDSVVPAATSAPATTSTAAAEPNVPAPQAPSNPSSSAPASSSASTSTSAAANTVPTPQKANTVGGTKNGKPKTCAHRKGKGKGHKANTHARRHREWQNRLIN